jgi:hypothetical protein
MVFDDSESWDDHTIVTWDYEGEDVIFSNKEKKKNITRGNKFVDLLLHQRIIN